VKPPNRRTRLAANLKRRIAIYLSVLLAGVVVTRFAGEALDKDPEALARLGAQLLPLAMLAVAGTTTFQLRRRGFAQGFAFWIPISIYLLIVLGFWYHHRISPDLRSMIPAWAVLALLCIPMVAVCGLLALLVRPRTPQIACVTEIQPAEANQRQPQPPNDPPEPVEMAGETPCLSPEATLVSGSLPARSRETHPLLGWFLLLLGVAGAAWFSHKIATRRIVYSWFGPQEFTLEDNLRAMGPIVLFLVYLVIFGVGVIRRWRWVGIPSLVLGFMAMFILLVALNR